MPRAWKTASRAARNTERSVRRPDRQSKSLEEPNRDATQRISKPPQAGSRSRLRRQPCRKIHLLDDVGRQEEHGATRVLLRDGSGREEDQRRCAEDVQEG